MFKVLFLILPFKINIPEKLWIYFFKNQIAEADQSILIDTFEFVWDDFWKLSKKPLSNSGGGGTKLVNHGK